MEREYEETIASDQFDLYDCLCEYLVLPRTLDPTNTQVQAMVTASTANTA